MGKYRTPSEHSKYYLPQEDYLTAIHYALRYPTLLAETPPADSGHAIRYDKVRVQTSGQYDATSDLAIRRSNNAHKIRIIEDTLLEVAPEKGNIPYFLKLGVCYGYTYNQLCGKGLSMGQRQYYEMRRHFYFELIKKI